KLQIELASARRGTGRLSRPWSKWWFSPRPIAAFDGGVGDSSTRKSRGLVTQDWRRPLDLAPIGRYQLHEIVTVPNDPALIAEFGTAYLLFEPLDGDAARAEASGRLALAIHAGAPGADGALRGTTGHLRVEQATLDTLLALTEHATEEIYLEVTHTDRAGPAAVSTSPPSDLALPEGAARRFRSQRATTDDRDDRDSTSTSSSSSSTSSSTSRDGGSEPWRAGGGKYAGAGSSGGWDDVVGTRAAMVAGAAVGAAATIASAAAAESSHPDSTQGSGTAY
ncbi:MAG: hypothetical protein ABIU95_16955, partial [Burkholderiales bacterium]